MTFAQQSRTLQAQIGKVIPVTCGLGSLLTYMSQSKQLVPNQLIILVPAVTQDLYRMCLNWLPAMSK